MAQAGTRQEKGRQGKEKVKKRQQEKAANVSESEQANGAAVGATIPRAPDCAPAPACVVPTASATSAACARQLSRLLLLRNSNLARLRLRLPCDRC